MITVRNLTKRFVNVLAVADASFEVHAGEVMGFLGPNGAGKTTTLRILTGFLPATRGTARVAGLDVLRESLEVRARVGYLPENVPLYLEMRVQEYLSFRARLKGLGRRQAAARVDDVLEECGLGEMRRRIVGQLSKGYRQRVGLADALLASPPVLILDEPTAGLDPGQRKEVRKLIQRMGERRTILLSSHILAEVEDVCDRVMIIKRGRILAIGTPPDLVRSLQEQGEFNRVHLETREGPDLVEPVLAATDGVVGSQHQPIAGGWHRFEVTVTPGEDPRATLVDRLTAAGAGLREIRLAAMTLEEIFLRLTAEAATDETIGPDPQTRPAGGVAEGSIRAGLLEEGPS